MKNDRPTTAAARLLTALSLRADLATRHSEEHLALQAEYERALALRRRRETLRRDLAALDREIDRADSLLDRRVSATRFILRAHAELARTSGRAA